jgi:peptidylprolyl isomerase
MSFNFRILLGFSFALCLIPLACAPTPSAQTKPDSPEEKVISLPSGLKYVDLKEGTGEPARLGDVIEVHYTGWFADKRFESSRDSGLPSTFQIGAGSVIKGWEEGITGMRAGGKRKLVIPAALAYGAEGQGDVIPPNADLTFEVELLKVKTQQ